MLINRFQIFVVIISFAFIISCSNDNPVIEDDRTLTNPDTLKRELIDGIFLSCDSLQDSYSLDQEINGYIKLENISNTEGLHIFIGSYPPFIGWTILDPEDNFISGGPTIVGLAEFNDTLKIGEMLKDRFTWYHNISDPNEMYSGLKAFSGKYILRIGFFGIPYTLNPYLIKKIEITEKGEALSCNLYRDYSKSDSINYDFIIRNRITEEVTLTSKSDSNHIYFYNEVEKDTVFQYSFLHEIPVYKLKGHSDNTITRFRFSKKYFIDKGITGAFKIIIKLNYLERTIVDENLLFIL